MINLLGSDYIVSNHNLNETWDLVVKAITESSATTGPSRQEILWKVIEDRAGLRLTAVMEYQKTLRLKRRLTLEVNFYPLEEDNQVRLELRYSISPMLNINEPEALLADTADAIAEAVGTQLVTAEDVALRAVPVKGQSGLLLGIEIILGINLLVMIIGAATGNGTAAVSSLLSVQFALLIPCATIYAIYKGMTRPEQSTGQRVLLGVGAVIGGILISIIAIPIVLFGLCIGAMIVMSHQ